MVGTAVAAAAAAEVDIEPVVEAGTVVAGDVEGYIAVVASEVGTESAATTSIPTATTSIRAESV